jgi:putative ABC transport system substrate-binding protein
MHDARRRGLLYLLAGAAVARPVSAFGQQRERVRRIGVLMANAESDPEFQQYLNSFREGLKRFGWIEGQNIRIEARWGALDDAEMRKRAAQDLIASNPDVILSQNTPPTAAMLQQTHTVPIVFVIVADPVSSRFVANLAHPGGNATGFTIMEPKVASKWLELLKRVAPRVDRVAILFNPATTPYARIYLEPFHAAAASFGLKESEATVHEASGLESAFAAEAQRANGSMIVMPDGFLNVHREEVVSLAARYRVPTIYPWKFFPQIGGLLSYGNDQNDSFRQAASYVDRILRGDKPEDLPVQAPVTFELVINMKTAKTLGLDVPESLQQLADELID